MNPFILSLLLFQSILWLYTVDMMWSRIVIPIMNNVLMIFYHFLIFVVSADYNFVLFIILIMSFVYSKHSYSYNFYFELDINNAPFIVSNLYFIIRIFSFNLLSGLSGVWVIVEPVVCVRLSIPILVEY